MKNPNFKSQEAYHKWLMMMGADSGFKYPHSIYEATTYEQSCLWKEYAAAEHPSNWSQRGGYLLTLGNYHNRPVCISLELVYIYKKPVLFWYATSQIVHNGWIDKFFKKCYPGVERTNAMNFNCPKSGE